MKLALAIALAVLPALSIAASLGGPAIARTKEGNYLGSKATTRSGKEFFQFEGIKYASSTRFKPATSVKSSQLIHALKPGPPCLQATADNSIIGSEDCLYMNIYTPKLNGSLPVMVFIHGGGFVAGRALTGPDFYMETQGVVLVFIQYRLGIMGLSDFGSGNYPSNLALKDVVFGLNWLKTNAGSFGGDPNKITLQGQSSGSVFVHLLILSPLTKGLIVGGISESGVGCATWATTEPEIARGRLQKLAALVDCPQPPSYPLPADETANCLQQLPSEDLIKASYQYQVNTPLDYMVFQPVIENSSDSGAAVIRYPWKQPQPNQVPWITGVNSDEGLGLIEAFGFPLSYLIEVFDSGMFDAALPYILQFGQTSTQSDNITRVIEAFYQKGKPLNDDNISIFTNKVLSGGMFNFPKYQCLNLHKRSPAWTYYFGYLRDFEKNRPGVKHSEELDYLFVNSTYNIRVNGSTQDAQVSEQLVQLFTSFAKYQKPIAADIDWQEYNSSTNEVFLIDNKGMKMSKDPKEVENKLWSRLPIRDRLSQS